MADRRPHHLSVDGKTPDKTPEAIKRRDAITLERAAGGQ
jgi:hypothetical protein